jgi:hypothetical protein
MWRFARHSRTIRAPDDGRLRRRQSGTVAEDGMEKAGTARRVHRRRRMSMALAVAAVVAAGVPTHAAAEAAGRIERIDIKADGSSTKVILMLSRPLAFDVRVLDGDAARKTARRLVLDFADTTLGPDVTKPIEVANDRLQQVRPGQFNAKTARIVLDLVGDTKHSVDAFETPPHVKIALGDTSSVGVPPGATDPAIVTAPAGGAPAARAADPLAVPAAAAPVAAPPPAATSSAASESAARKIPIRARGRRPYSLNYSR